MNANSNSVRLPGYIVQRLSSFVSAVAPGLKPRFQTVLIRTAYSTISVILKNEDSAFLNYGYVPLDSDTPTLTLDSQDEADRFSIQLYSHVAGRRDLRGKDVLEIGCGRGGGASFMARYLPAGFPDRCRFIGQGGSMLPTASSRSNVSRSCAARPNICRFHPSPSTPS